MKTFGRNLLIVALVSFGLHYLWEYWQCGIFYIMSAGPEGSRLMWSATFGDMNMSIILYGLLSFINHDSNWLSRKWTSKEYVIISLYALFLSFYFEVSALHTGRWGYSENMPFFPNTNIGLVPVIQLLLLFPLSFLISKWILKFFQK